METDWGWVARVDRDGYTPHFVESFNRDEAEHRGAICCALFERFSVEMEVVEDTSVVPVVVACEGKASIAAYLYAVQLESIEDVSSRLDVSTASVEQYLSDFRYGRR